MATLDPDGDAGRRAASAYPCADGVGALTEWEELPGRALSHPARGHRARAPRVGAPQLTRVLPGGARGARCPTMQGDAGATRASVDAVRGLMMSLRVRNPKLARSCCAGAGGAPRPGRVLEPPRRDDARATSESQYELLGMTDVSSAWTRSSEHLSDFLARRRVPGEDELN